MAAGATQLPHTDHQLALLIESATGRRVAHLSRTSWPYYSSAVMESLDVHWHDGGGDKILAKQTAGSSTTSVRPAFLISPSRESLCYQMLAKLNMDTPAYFGFDPDHQLLLIEQVEGLPLWQIGDVNIWCAAARWLAKFHTTFVQPIAQPIEYDDLFYTRWLDRAQEFTVAANRDRVDRVASAYRAMLPRLLGLSIQPIHGEFVASNILIQESADGYRVRVVDWEMTSLGPAMMDLADLTAGDWPREDKQLMVEAYQQLSPKYSAEALLLCRFARAVQWMGWVEGWRAPAEDAHDWLADAESMIEEVERLCGGQSV